MNASEFEKVKKLLEGEGFEIFGTGLDNSKLFKITKKDPWEGVEFIIPNHNSPCVKKPYKVVSTNDGFVQVYCPYSGYGNLTQLQKNEVDPSTEEAYIEQLKREAFKRFGEIKEFDRFDLSSMGYSSNAKIFLSRNPTWDYNKKRDELSLESFTLYKQGKWAVKLDKITKVYSGKMSHFGHSIQMSFEFSKFCNVSGDDIVNHLREKLEEFINTEYY